MDSYEKKYKEMKARVLEIGQGYVKGVDFSKPRQIAEYIDPELKESDEKIRQLLVRFVTLHMGDNYSNNISKEECLAWFEKQGEKEKFIEKELGCIRGYREEALRRLHELEKQGEQEIKKKTIWKHWKNGIAGNGEGKQIYLIKSGDSYTLSSCLGYECDYIDLSDLDEFMLSEKQGEQKPAWSEEDEDAIGIAIIALDDMYDPDEPNTTYAGYSMPFNKAAERLKSIKDRIQPKQEWSEEDEQLIDEVAVCLRKYAEKVQGGYSKSYVQSLADRIESLRPGNTCKATEWSEEDEAMFQGVIETEQYMLDVVYGRKIFAVGNEDIKEECTKELAWLKSLKDRIK